MLKVLRVVSLASSLLLSGHAISAEQQTELGFKPLPINWEKMSKLEMKDGFISLFNKNCASCHGEDLAGTGLGPALVGVKLRYGDTPEALANSIRKGSPATGMPAAASMASRARFRSSRKRSGPIS